MELSRVIDFDSINRGFSAKALVYDNYGADHPVILWARAQVRGQLMTLVSPGANVLELAAGTGADAAFWLSAAIASTRPTSPTGW